jgi:hypothetical protein
MQQIKVSIPDELLTEIQEAASMAGRGLSEEVRERLMGTAGRIDLGRPDIAALMEKIGQMAVLVEFTTEKRWDKDAATTHLLALAVGKLLQRYGAKEGAELSFSETYQREGLVVSTDPTVIATGLEALVHFDVRLGDRPELRELWAEAEAKIRERGKS